MSHWLGTRSFKLDLIAETGDRFEDFSPYVPSLNDDGLVAFAAKLAGAGTGVFTGDGSSVKQIGCSGEIISHPDINLAGDTCFYEELPDGRQCVLVSGETSTKVKTEEGFANIGPLGPTMNESGKVAFRADTVAGHNGVFTVVYGSVERIADTGSRFKAFYGLPVVRADGSVVFRADEEDGTPCICESRAGVISTIASEEFSDLGFFPDTNGHGAVVFAATLKTGESGIFVAKDGAVEQVVAGFESFRGALIDNAEKIVFYATPFDGRLGVYAGPDPATGRIIGIGESLCGSVVSEFALNPVSMNNRGQIAVRIKLENSRQMIVRIKIWR